MASSSAPFMYIGLRIGKQSTFDQEHRTKQEIYEAVSRMADSEQFNIEQRNGQRLFGPPIGRPILQLPRECEVFLGCIPRNVYEDQLIPLLKMAGSLFLFRLMMDFTGSNRGFGFALYENAKDAAEACRIMNNFEILPGRFMVCIPCFDNNSLYLGGIRNKSAEEMISIIFHKTPAAIHVSITTMDERAKRYAVIRFASHRDAALARRFYLVSNYQLWQSRSQVIVDWRNRHTINVPFFMVASKNQIDGGVQFNYLQSHFSQPQHHDP